jgi:hypothetical protein
MGELIDANGQPAVVMAKAFYGVYLRDAERRAKG